MKNITPIHGGPVVYEAELIALRSFDDDGITMIFSLPVSLVSGLPAHHIWKLGWKALGEAILFTAKARK